MAPIELRVRRGSGAQGPYADAHSGADISRSLSLSRMPMPMEIGESAISAFADESELSQSATRSVCCVPCSFEDVQCLSYMLFRIRCQQAYSVSEWKPDSRRVIERGHLRMRVYESTSPKSPLSTSALTSTSAESSRAFHVSFGSGDRTFDSACKSKCDRGRTPSPFLCLK